jgi:hypothetical protein
MGTPWEGKSLSLPIVESARAGRKTAFSPIRTNDDIRLASSATLNSDRKLGLLDSVHKRPLWDWLHYFSGNKNSLCIGTVQLKFSFVYARLHGRGLFAVEKLLLGGASAHDQATDECQEYE